MITHKGTQTIRTERLILRKFTVDDAPAMFEGWASDERVTRYLTWDPHGSPEETRQLLALWCAGYQSPAAYHWAMEYKGALIGDISVVQLDERSEHASLGYCIGHAYWGRGLMTEAAKAVIDYLFGEVGVNRVEISHAVKNPASGRVAQKCGLIFEGTKREFFKNSAGEFLDISFYGILKSEWEEQKAWPDNGIL